LWDDSPSAPNNQNPRVSLLPSGLIPNAIYTGSLATFPHRMARDLQSKRHPRSALVKEGAQYLRPGPVTFGNFKFVTAEDGCETSRHTTSEKKEGRHSRPPPGDLPDP